MSNIIIQNRLKKLTATKRYLLTLKKDKRGNGLKEVNETIARLKRWDKELERKERIKNITKTTIKVTNNAKQALKGLISATKEVSEGMKRFREACEMENTTFCESVKYNKVNHFGN